MLTNSPSSGNVFAGLSSSAGISVPTDTPGDSFGKRAINLNVTTEAVKKKLRRALKPAIVSIEGIIGSGKSELLAELEKRYFGNRLMSGRLSPKVERTC